MSDTSSSSDTYNFFEWRDVTAITAKYGIIVKLNDYEFLAVPDIGYKKQPYEIQYLYQNVDKNLAI